MAFKIVYDLKDDQHYIELVQKATLETTDFGLVPEHGLFGSTEWWSAITSGKIPIRVIEGVITRVYLASMNDWPEFELESNNKKST